MVDIKWEEPPKQLLGRGRTNWEEIASALKSNPEQWAVVAENVSASTGTHIRYGRLKAFEPSGAFEARVSGAHSAENGRAEKIYARYIGAKTSTPSTTSTPEPVSVASAGESDWSFQPWEDGDE
jgi:hypothetical protein